MSAPNWILLGNRIKPFGHEFVALIKFVAPSYVITSSAWRKKINGEAAKARRAIPVVLFPP